MSDQEAQTETPGMIEVRDQDRHLPIANIARIMKRGLPENAKVSKEAKESAQECVSEFISFITSEASTKVRNEKRKTITGDDVLFAMSNLGFGNYIEPLKIYLNKYRDALRGNVNNSANSTMNLGGNHPTF